MKQMFLKAQILREDYAYLFSAGIINVESETGSKLNK